MNVSKSSCDIETKFTSIQIKITETNDFLKACATWLDLKERD